MNYFNTQPNIFYKAALRFRNIFQLIWLLTTLFSIDTNVGLTYDTDLRPKWNYFIKAIHYIHWHGVAKDIRNNNFSVNQIHTNKNHRLEFPTFRDLAVVSHRVTNSSDSMKTFKTFGRARLAVFFAQRPNTVSTPHAHIDLQMAEGKLFVRFFSYFAFCQDVPVYTTTYFRVVK